MYNLDELFRFVEYNDRSQSRHVSCRHKWIRSLCEEKDMGKTSFEVDLECKQFSSFLVPFLFSLNNRPDGVVYFKQADSLFLPLLMLEIH